MNGQEPLIHSISGRLPCPFCGSVGLSLISLEGRPLMIQCNACLATGPSLEGASTDELARLWDTRAEVVQ